MASTSSSYVAPILLYFHQNNLLLSDFLLTLLSDVQLSTDPIVNDLKIKSDKVVTVLLNTSTDFMQAQHDAMKQIYKAEVTELAKPDHGLHFSASNVSVEQLESFQMDEMATRMAQIAPYLWDLLDTLLLTCGMGNILMQEGDHDDQDNLAEEGLEGVFLNAAPGDRNHAKKTRQHDQKLALIQIVSAASVRVR
jgi:hypothetical protein